MNSKFEMRGDPRSRLAVFSNAYGNAHALKCGIEAAKSRGATHFAFLGGAIGHGQEPNECLKLLDDFDVWLNSDHDESFRVSSRAQSSGRIVQRLFDWTARQSWTIPEQPKAANWQGIKLTSSYSMHPVKSEGLTVGRSSCGSLLITVDSKEDWVLDRAEIQAPSHTVSTIALGDTGRLQSLGTVELALLDPEYCTLLRVKYDASIVLRRMSALKLLHVKDLEIIKGMLLNNYFTDSEADRVIDRARSS